MNLKNWLTQAEQQLSPISSTPRLDAEVLLFYALNINKTKLYTAPETLISDIHLSTLTNLLSQRIAGNPIAYILGEKEFWSMNFKVTPAVLIPRPETEHLIELSLSLLDTHQSHTILELGTGSGIIAITLAKERPNWQILACDISSSALDVAKENAKQLLSSQNNLSFCQSNWFNDIPSQTFTTIISNPPYIAENDTHLTALQYEPINALTSGSDGLDDIRKIITKSPSYLSSEGMLLLEHGYNQANAIQEIFKEANFSQIKTYRDLGGQERVTVGKKFKE
jgi:release factor glutamine methyltransferase